MQSSKNSSESLVKNLLQWRMESTISRKTFDKFLQITKKYNICTYIYIKFIFIFILIFKE